MNMTKRIFPFFLISFLLLCVETFQSQTRISSAAFGDLNARQIGPAAMSGRITAIDAVNNDSRIVWVGAAGGGVWKSITGGTLFKSVFDKYCQSIGAIAIDQKNPDVVWVGTGESNMRNSVAIGDGIYRTLDGGDSWLKMGLENSEHISKIVIDPDNSDIVYVAVPGALWGDSPDRGLYKTYDGGKTWDKILFVDDKTGCADIIIDPKDPNIIYASMWQFRRRPWAFASGGPGSGLYKSEDAGRTWRRIDKGFTVSDSTGREGELGRIALAISPSDTKIIYAIAESKNTALFVSKDGGETWKKNSSTGNVVARPFYFSVLKVDPTDSKRVYRPAFSLSISDDGGETYRSASFEGGWVHSDHHALWIDPKNPQHLYLGTDGGVYVSFDRGNNWLFLNNLPVSQYYHIDYDMEKPYNVYGGLQDNGSWIGPSSSPGGISVKDWQSIGFGDGFSVISDRSDDNIVYWESQGGNVERYNKVTHQNKDVEPYPLKGEDKLRFNWNTPIYPSPNDPHVIYVGAQYLYRSNNMGDSWDKISPDLTTNDKEKQKQEESGGLSVDNSSAENHCTIFVVNESPVDGEIIWVGTDDGNLQVTQDGGAKWTNVVKNVPGLPPFTWVSSVDASKYSRNSAFATFDGHALGDMRTYIYKTTDLGKTWHSIATSDIKGFAYKIKQDIVNPNLLFAGTTFGLYVSIDGGSSWAQYTANLPPVEVRDIAIHPETNDLLLATHGRGILIVDDITPLRKLTNEILNSDAFVLTTSPTLINGKSMDGSYPNQAGYFVGPDKTDEAVIAYYLKDRAVTGEVKVEIYDKDGKLLKSLPGTKRKGINKVTWNMQLPPPKVATGVSLEFGGFFGPIVPEGTYTVKLVKGDKSFSGSLVIKSDPSSFYSESERELQRKTFMRLYEMQVDLAYLVEKINKIKDSSNALIKNGNLGESMQSSLKNLVDTLEGLRKTLVATKESKGITGEERLREKMGGLYASVGFYPGRPTNSLLERIDGLEFDFQKADKQADDIFRKNLDKINKELKASGKGDIPLLSREDFDKEGSSGVNEKKEKFEDNE
jgi:photosystem II stability/assembly factor-like uncharacterized protein